MPSSVPLGMHANIRSDCSTLLSSLALIWLVKKYEVADVSVAKQEKFGKRKSKALIYLYPFKQLVLYLFPTLPAKWDLVMRSKLKPVASLCELLWCSRLAKAAPVVDPYPMEQVNREIFEVLGIKYRYDKKKKKEADFDRILIGIVSVFHVLWFAAEGKGKTRCFLADD